MGVKGLNKVLKTRLGEAPERQKLPDDAHLVFDGFSFMFSIINGLSDYMPEFGGNHDVVDRGVKAEVERLRAMGLDLVVVLDGSNNPQFKKYEKIKRSSERAQDWVDLWTHCHDLDFMSSQSSNLSVAFYFTYVQFKATLWEMGVQIVRSNGEAELEIARRVRVHNKLAGREQAFAYGGDSDFMVMADCPFIQNNITNIDGKPWVDRVWRRKETASLLGISESLFVGNT